jgi:mannosyltransferase
MKKTANKIFHFFQSRPKTDYIFVGLAIAVFFALAFWTITKYTIWFDEAFSAYIIKYNFIEIARYTATDVHPPLFYWILKIWSSVFGQTDIGLRSMSVVFGAVAVLFGFLLVRRQFGRKAALISVFILVISPLFVRYSQEARMYTLATAIVLSATFVMLKAAETKSRKLWVLYGVLVSAGMWTHYFTILAWLAHWAWRYVTVRQGGSRGKALFRKFFSREWLTAYITAIVLFLPWLPAMAIQLVVVQSNGFWIGPVGVDTLGTYFGTLAYYLEHDHVTGYASLALILMGILTMVFALRIYRTENKATKRNYALLLALAAVPPFLLFVVSMPPLTSSFVERYVLPAAAASALFMGVTLVYGMKGLRIWKQLLVYALVAAMLLYGLTNMYFYGNYNKNSRTDILTKQLVQDAMAKSPAGTPIIMSTPWTFYEAIFYATAEHPVYFIDADVDYGYGSLDMLKYSDAHKIKDFGAFAKEHPTVWYMGYSQGVLESPDASWKAIDSITETSSIDGQSYYKGIEYDTAQ